MHRKPTKRDGANAKTDRKRPAPRRKAAKPPEAEEVPEYERRFLVQSMDLDVLRSPSTHIRQGYLDDGDGPRIRIEDGAKATVTRKTGKGIDRREKNYPPKGHPHAVHPAAVGLAAHILSELRYTLEKKRHVREGWEIDVFQGPLNDFIFAEFEMEHPDMEVTLPPWIHDAIEVTDTIDNRMLAKLAYDISLHGTDRPVREHLIVSPVRKLVVTGGPGSGKTTALKALHARFGGSAHFLPEIVTVIKTIFGLEPPVGDPIAMVDYQRTIYRLQRRLEDGACKEAHKKGKKLVIVDRGTVDSAAYLPRGADDLAHITGRTLTDHYRRYESVLFLGTPPRKVYERIAGNNSARTETYEEAVACAERTFAAWAGHPRFVRIEDGDSWDDKYARIERQVLRLLD